VGNPNPNPNPKEATKETDNLSQHTCYNAVKWWLKNGSVEVKEVGVIHQTHDLQLKEI